MRLEKWSSILKDSNDYPENIKHELDVNTIQSAYNDILVRATLENQVIKFGVLSAEVRENLISIKSHMGGIHYPKPSWDKVVLKNRAINISLIIGFLVNFIILGLGVALERTPFWMFIMLFVSFIFACIMVYLLNRGQYPSQNEIDELTSDVKKRPAALNILRDIASTFSRETTKVASSEVARWFINWVSNFA